MSREDPSKRGGRVRERPFRIHSSPDHGGCQPRRCLNGGSNQLLADQASQRGDAKASTANEARSTHTEGSGGHCSDIHRGSRDCPASSACRWCTRIEPHHRRLGTRSGFVRQRCEYLFRM